MTKSRYLEEEWTGPLDPESYAAEYELAKQIPVMVYVAGPCPSCLHQSSDEHPLFRSHGFNVSSDPRLRSAQLERTAEHVAAGRLTLPDVIRADLLCRCDEEHEGQENRGDGCGTSYSLSLARP